MAFAGGAFGGKGPSLGGGLFQQPQNTTQPAQNPSLSGGMFGASTSAPQASGLFGQTPMQRGTAFASTAFGNPGAASQPQQQQQQTGSGMFGSGFTLGGTPQQQQQPASTSGLGFGGLGASTQPPGGSVFGGISQPAPASSLFASTNQPQNQLNQQTQQNQQNQQNRQNGGTNTYFDTIKEQSRKRALGEMADDDFPQLQFGLGDLRQRMKKFAPGDADKATNSRAHYLLSGSGVDPGAAVRDLKLLSTNTGRVEQPQPQEAAETDIDGYLANLQTQTTLNMISDGLARSVRDFDAFLEDNVTMEWDAQRKRIYQHFGIKPRETKAAGGRSGFAASESQGGAGFGQSRRSKAAALAGSRSTRAPGGSEFGRSGLQKSVIGSAAPIGSTFQPLFSDIEKRMEAGGIAAPDPNDRFQRERQGRLAQKVQSLNDARLQKGCFPILHEFQNAVREGGEEHSVSISKAYGAMIKIVGETSEALLPSDPLAVKERQFSAAYLDETSKSSININIKKRILRGSAEFLEEQFFQEVESYIAKSPREANLGGVPDVLSKVKAYVRLKATRKDLALDNIDLQMLEGDYVWALVFYLLRSGHVREAVNYVTAKATAFRGIDRNFASYITDYHSNLDKRLRRELQERINNEYNQRLRVAPENSIDPFRMACYKVIGRCDLKSRALEPTITNQSSEDYMWLQFILARESPEVNDHATEVCNLESVQNVIKEIGTRYFSKGTNFGAYFYLQILGGFFEEAIEYLYPYSYPDAVHFAIALDYYGLFRVSDPDIIGETSLLSYTTRGLPQIKYGHMIGHYTRDFRAANVTAAVDYLILICLNGDLPGQLGRKQVALCHDALRELVLESREFALLLGDIRHDGQRIKGVIEDRMKLIALQETDDFMRTITIQAASVADDNGRVTDAVLLYHLAEEFDNVVVIITRAMSEAASVQIGQDQMRLQPLKPRATPAEQQNQVNSLSLTSVDDPVILGDNMHSLYRSNRMYRSKIKEDNWKACETLLKVSEVKVLVEAGQWAAALDKIQELDTLPIKVGGNAGVIRGYATQFSSLSQPVANIIPNLLMWAIMCTSKQLAHCTGAEFGANEGTNASLIQELRQQTMDLTTYTSMLRYRFPAYLSEALARAQSE